MNRLIIVGNGFDIAHNLPTRYKQFIDWYFNTFNDRIRKCSSIEVGDELCSLRLTGTCNYDSFNRLLRFEGIANDELNRLKGYSRLVRITESGLLKEIVYSMQTKNWVDLEQDYYNLLIRKGENSIEYLTKTDKLNKDLECLKRHLFDYLQLICGDIEHSFKCIPSMTDLIMAPIRKEDIAVSSLELWERHVDDRMKLTYDEMCDRLLGYNLDGGAYWKLNAFIESGKASLGYEGNMEENAKIPNAYYIPERTMLLNFNYTDIADQYLPKGNSSFEINHIHGSLENVDSMIFGYGDELDENYKNLENKNDNEYMRNMKSIRYQETDNYRRMLSFIESAPYQIFILGHSCGISDRTLLNTLFEHKNCASIKPFYHHDGVRDNYNDIIASISRNFTDMKKMRDRVVNKTYCQPLPQAKTITLEE